MTHSELIALRTQLKTGALSGQLKAFIENKKQIKVRELLETNPKDHEMRDQIVGELIALTSVIPLFESFLDELIRTTAQ